MSGTRPGRSRQSWTPRASAACGPGWEPRRAPGWPPGSSGGGTAWPGCGPPAASHRWAGTHRCVVRKRCERCESTRATLPGCASITRSDANPNERSTHQPIIEQYIINQRPRTHPVRVHLPFPLGVRLAPELQNVVPALAEQLRRLGGHLDAAGLGRGLHPRRRVDCGRRGVRSPSAAAVVVVVSGRVRGVFKSAVGPHRCRQRAGSETCRRG